MNNNYLRWSSITREERFFCSHLYHNILGREKDFVNWLNENSKPEGYLKINGNKKWEISYEVCFYRDFIKANEETIKAYNLNNNTNYPPKRTFDLCLFTEDEIIIIEAKVQQGFSNKQMAEIAQDDKLVSELVKTIMKKDIGIKTILLYSSIYKPKEDVIKYYPFFTWKDLHSSPFSYKNYFKLADEKFRK